MLATDIQVLSDMLINTPPGTAIFIAEDEQGVAVGFIHLQTAKDYYCHFCLKSKTKTSGGIL